MAELFLIWKQFFDNFLGVIAVAFAVLFIIFIFFFLYQKMTSSQ